MFRTDESTIQYIMSHLNEDIESVARSAPPLLINPSLPQSSIRNGCIIHTNNNNNNNNNNVIINNCNSHDNQEHKEALLPEMSVLVLQVVRVQDVSQSLEQHLRSITSNDNSNNNNNSSSKVNTESEADDVTSTHYGEMALQMSEEAEQEAWAREREKLHNKGSFVSNSGNNLVSDGQDMNNSSSSNNNNNNINGNTFVKGTSRYRHLRLELTDGFTRIVAVEERHVLCNCQWHMSNRNNESKKYYNLSLPLFPQGIALGAKIKIEWSTAERNTPRVTNGILRLSGKNTVVLGGSGVVQIQMECEVAARYLLQAMTGKPTKLEFKNNNNNSSSIAATTTTTTTSSSISTNTSSNNRSNINNNNNFYSANEEEQKQLSTLSTSSSHILPSLEQQQQQQQQHYQEAAPLQPLEAWRSFCNNYQKTPQATFRTRAVITGVLNDLEMREYFTNTTTPANSKNDGNEKSNTVNNMTLSSSTSATSAVQVYYSLLVSLSSPSDQDENNELSANADLTTVTCDLGNTFLSTVIGMPANLFRQLHLSHNEDDRERVQLLIEQVSLTLEHFGVAEFTLKQQSTQSMSKFADQCNNNSENNNSNNNNSDISTTQYIAELIAVRPLSSPD